MKNKFKKSKIIVPALALITATTVASVTGTVAWFTATRAVSVSTNEFVATKLESKLNVNCSAGVGTTASNASVTVNGKLTHGSYDAKTSASGSLYVAKINDTDTTKIDEYKDLGIERDTQQKTATTSENKWLARFTEDSQTWYGVSWKMTFSLEENTTGQTDYLIFDPSGSSYNIASTTTTAPGIRIALMTESQCIVFGNSDTKTHTKGTQSTDVESFTNYVKAGTTVTKLADDGDTVSSSNYTLGSVSKTTSLDVTCVAWYEGSDTNVADKIGETEITMSTVTSTLAFYTRYVRN